MTQEKEQTLGEEVFEPYLLEEDEAIEVLQEGSVPISLGKYEALRKIKERSLIQFYKRFAKGELSGTARNKMRQAERFLDKRNVKTFAPDNEKPSYYLFSPGQNRGLMCAVKIGENEKRYHYMFVEIDKSDGFVGMS